MERMLLETYSLSSDFFQFVKDCICFFANMLTMFSIGFSDAGPCAVKRLHSYVYGCNNLNKKVSDNKH